jgi:hypothetical protein
MGTQAGGIDEKSDEITQKSVKKSGQVSIYLIRCFSDKQKRRRKNECNYFAIYRRQDNTGA